MGLRKKRRLKYDEEENEYKLVKVADDSRRVAKADRVNRILNTSGATAEYLRQMSYLDFESGEMKIDKSKVVNEIAAVASQIKDARYYGRDEADRQAAQVAERYKISDREAFQIEAREMKQKAVAILKAAEFSGVPVPTYERGILNGLARGDYMRVVYGRQDESGRRTYDRGTFNSRLRGGRGDSNAEAVEAGYLTRGGRRRGTGKNTTNNQTELDRLKAEYRQAAPPRPATPPPPARRSTQDTLTDAERRRIAEIDF